jgi:hypothetical protein
LRAKVASSTPVPRPVTCSADAPVTAAVVYGLVGEARSGLDRADRLLPCHGGSDRDVRGPRPDRTLDEVGRAPERARDPEVGDDDARPRLAREHVHRRAPAREVLDHLRGHDLGIRADALGDDSMIGREREDDRTRDRGRPAAQDREAQRDLLEPAEAARRLRQAVEMVTSRRLAVPCRSGDRVEQPGEVTHARAPASSR